MQTKKRFTEISVWEFSWFSNLNITQKLFWLYLNHRCDNVGVWDPNFKLAAYHLEIKDDPEEFANRFLKLINLDEDRIIVLNNGKWFLTHFVKFQFVKGKPLNPRNPAHKSYLSQIYDYGMYQWYVDNQPEVLFHVDNPIEENRTLKELSKTSPLPVLPPLETYKDIETDKEKDVVIDIDKEEYKDDDKGNDDEYDVEYNPIMNMKGYNKNIKYIMQVNPFVDVSNLHKDFEILEVLFHKFLEYGWDEMPLVSELRSFVRNGKKHGSFENILYEFEEKFESKSPKPVHYPFS